MLVREKITNCISLAIATKLCDRDYQVKAVTKLTRTVDGRTEVFQEVFAGRVKQISVCLLL